MIIKLIVSIRILYDFLFSPIFIQLYVIIINILYPRIKFRYKHANGGIVYTMNFSKEGIFCIYEIPDDNIFSAYYRRFNNLNRFMIPMTFDFYVTKFNILDMVNVSAKICNYKTLKINNLNYKTNYDYKENFGQ